MNIFLIFFLLVQITLAISIIVSIMNCTFWKKYMALI